MSIEETNFVVDVYGNTLESLRQQAQAEADKLFGKGRYTISSLDVEHLVVTVRGTSHGYRGRAYVRGS